MKNLQKFKDELNWEEKAKINPLYAIMSDDVFKNSTKNPSDEEVRILYKKGERFWKRWFGPLLLQMGFELKNIKIMEYGCGMGRILRVPALEGAEVYGVDISLEQLNLAKKYFPSNTDVTWIKFNPKERIAIDNNTIDFVYSHAVFQHIKRLSDVIFALKEICRVLKHGGVTKLQFNSLLNPFGNFDHTGLRKNFLCTNFENVTIIGYWRKTGFCRLPVLRIVKHTNWSGARISYKKVSKFLKSQGLEVVALEYGLERSILWITAIKKY